MDVLSSVGGEVGLVGEHGRRSCSGVSVPLHWIGPAARGATVAVGGAGRW
ncbi:MAG: hypothetical protein AVDCRST_MAG20-1637 [uncultured Acidimicrobiales bacterium]|uniref:Uncharacterized protein n=1 Tax=uncultured Acidimicrobiales bacterium TaxID=310071 RepID=A0A6J4I2B0_9ACTN|nr:MAG: hypothetical protein AVDCRST_MAG20-1637 [uncultured Acidimicrobiales bacterium]